MANIVEFKNVNMSFGNNKVLKDIDLEIEKGKFYTLLGPSGCGKSTILKLIGGFLSPTSGDVLLDGKVVNDLPANKRHVNTVPGLCFIPTYECFRKCCIWIKN